MELGLNGRRALVTGASAGLGLATARALAADGASVVIAARGRERLESTGLPFVVADVSRADHIDELFDRAESMLGGIDILVANAGGPPAGNFESTALDAYQPAIQANLLSTVAMCKRVIPGMTSRKWGRIVAITSYSVREPVPHLILSNTARAGVTAFLKTLSREVAHHGITVNTLQPGLHLTDRLAGLYPDQAALDAAAKTVPAGTIGDPDDFGHIAAFLCSDHARYITGASIPVDGGALRGLQ